MRPHRARIAASVTNAGTIASILSGYSPRLREERVRFESFEWNAGPHTRHFSFDLRLAPSPSFPSTSVTPPENPSSSRLLLTGIDGDRPSPAPRRRPGRLNVWKISARGDAAARAICVSTFRVSAFTSRTRPPVGQQRQQVEDADGAVVVEVRRAAGVGAPGGDRVWRAAVNCASVAECGGAWRRIKGLRHVAQPWGFIVSLTEPAGWLWGSQVIACRGYPGPEPRRW